MGTIVNCGMYGLTQETTFVSDTCPLSQNSLWNVSKLFICHYGVAPWTYILVITFLWFIHRLMHIQSLSAQSNLFNYKPCSCLCTPYIQENFVLFCFKLMAQSLNFKNCKSISILQPWTSLKPVATLSALNLSKPHFWFWKWTCKYFKSHFLFSCHTSSSASDCKWCDESCGGIKHQACTLARW